MVSWMGNKTYNRFTARHALWLAAPHTFAASVCPAVFGILYCGIRGIPLGVFRGILVILACVLLQSAVNTFNDYADFVNGTDSAEDHVEASDSVLVFGGVDPAQVKKLGVVYLLAGLFLGLMASLRELPVPVLIGALGGMTVLFYSGGPHPLSGLPLGEVVSGVVMGGLIPLGTVSCGDGRVHGELFFYSLPLMIGIGLIMMTNNGCDIEKDIRAGRRTLPAALGRKNAVKLYRLLLAFWLVSLVLSAVSLVGRWGFLSLPVLGLAGKRFLAAFHGNLLPENRISSMKNINAANVCAGFALFLPMLAVLLAEAVHG